MSPSAGSHGMVDATDIDISVVLPLYNEEDNLAPLVDAIVSKFPQKKLQIVMIDDGSTDGSWNKILKIGDRYSGRVNIDGVRLARNFGNQLALACGIEHASGEYIITMDADFQHPPEILPSILGELEDGAFIVHAIRRDLKHASRFKRYTSNGFHRLFNFLSDTAIPRGATDYRGFNRAVREAFLQVKDKARFNRAIFFWLGFPFKTVEYEEPPRKHGRTKLSAARLIELAIKGLTQFSNRPLYLSMIGFPIVGGLTLFLLLILYLERASWIKWVGSFPMLGAVVVTFVLWMILIVLIQLTQSLYLGRIFYEIKDRPLYIVLDRYSNHEGIY